MTPEIVPPIAEPVFEESIIDMPGIYQFEALVCSTGCEVAHELKFISSSNDNLNSENWIVSDPVLEYSPTNGKL